MIDIIKDSVAVAYYVSAIVLGWMDFFQNRK